MFLQRSSTKISTIKRFCFCYLLSLSTQANTNKSRICNKYGFKIEQCRGDRILTTSGKSCMWAANSLGRETLCEDIDKQSLRAVIHDKFEFEMMKELIERTLPKIAWIDMTYDGRRKRWFSGTKQIHDDDERIREITKARWGMTKDFNEIKDIRCLAAEYTSTGFWTNHFKTRVKYTLRDCGERLPFYCFKEFSSETARTDWKRWNYKFYNSRQAKAHKEAFKFCLNKGEGYHLIKFWKEVGNFNHFWQDQFKDTFMYFHMGLFRGPRNHFYWYQPWGPMSGYEWYERRFGIVDYENVEGKGNCVAFLHHGRFERQICESKRFKMMNAVCESPLEILENVQQKFKVHYHRRNKKFLLKENVKIECSGDTILDMNNITWKVMNPNGTEYNTYVHSTPKAIVYKENSDGLCLKELGGSFEFKVKNYWHDKRVNCYIPTNTQARYDHCDKQYCKGVTIDVLDTPLQKPEFSVSYPGYPGKVYEGMIVTITCVAKYSFQRFTELDKNSMVVFGSINKSTVVITNKLQNTSTFDIRTFHEELVYNRKWYGKLFTPTHRLYVEVTFNMTAELVGLTFDCFGIDVEYHELPKVCKLGDPYCTRSKRFGISVRPPPPPDDDEGDGPNFLAFFIVFTILSTLLFALLFIWCSLKKEQLPDAMEKRKKSNTDIVEVDEPTEQSDADNLGDGTTIISVVDQKSDAYSSLGVHSTKDGGSSILGARQTSISASHTTKSSGV